MKIKRMVSFIVILSLFVGMCGLPSVAYAQSAAALERFAQKVDALNNYATAEGLNTEQTIETRIIVSAASAPEPFGNARFIKGYRDWYVFQYASAAEAQEALAYYQSLPCVRWAQADKKYEAQDYLANTDSVQCGLHYLEQFNTQTARVNVAVIDTGINKSITMDGEQEESRLMNSGFNASNSGLKFSAWDDEGHGTNVCSIILDNTPESVIITGYKALNAAGEGDDLAVAMCIDKALEDGNSILNLSLSGEGESEPCLKEALQRAFDAGVMVVVAAGNENGDVSNYSPACVSEAVCVAAIDDNGNPESYSNYGEGVDFAAPGNVFGGGTSFSAPYITAVAAAVKAVHPESNSAQIEQIMKDSCYTFEQLNWHDSIHRNEGLRFEGLNHYEDYRTFTQYLHPCEDERLYYGAGMPNFALAIGMEQCEQVSFSVDPGHYRRDNLALTLSGEEGSTIYYTDDGSFPTAASNLYTTNPENTEQTQSISIEGIFAIRAVAFEEGKAPSIITAGEYLNEHLARESELSYTSNGIIRSYTGTFSAIVIPHIVNGVQVKSISGFKTPNTKLTCLTLPETVESCNNNNSKTGIFDALVYFKATGMTSIGEYCFFQAPLCTAEIPNVTSISQYAFYGTNIRTAAFPYASPGAYSFDGCKYLTSADFSLYNQNYDFYISSYAFSGCYRLKSVKTNPGKNCIVSSYAFKDCYSLKDFDFSNVTMIYSDAFAAVKGIKAVIAPKLKSVSSLPYSTELLYAPAATYLGAFPFAWHPLAVVPRSCNSLGGEYIKELLWFPKFFNSVEDLVICAAEDAVAHRYAEENEFRFVSIPAIVSEPENMGTAGGVLTADIIGIHLSYQWYGTNVRNNRAGTLLAGETARQLDSSKYAFPYYYCEATHFEPTQSTADEDYVKSIKTGYTGEDVNHDNLVDIGDVSLILANVAKLVVGANDTCDVDRNGAIDIVDVSALLLFDVFGKEQTLSSLDLPAWEHMYEMPN